MKGKAFPWFARRCSPPFLAGAQSPRPQRPGLPAHPPKTEGHCFISNGLLKNMLND